MVLAAATQGIPAALMEADAHLGLANRLALPFAKRVFLASAIPGRDGGKYRVTGRPIPVGSKAGRPERGAETVRSSAGRRGASRLRRQPGRAQPEPARRRELRSRRAARSPPRGRARLRGAPGTRSTGTAITCCRTRTTLALLSPLPISRSLAPGGSIYELAAAGTPAMLVPYPSATADHQTKNARVFERAGAADRRSRARARRRSGSRSTVSSAMRRASRRCATRCGGSPVRMRRTRSPRR